MNSHLREYQRFFRTLDNVFWFTGCRLTAKKPPSVFWGLLLNHNIPMTLCTDFLFVYCVMFEASGRFIAVQQLWAFVAVFQIFVRGVRRYVYWDEMDELLKWFEDVFARQYKPQYREIVERNLQKMLQIICLGNKWVE